MADLVPEFWRGGSMLKVFVWLGDEPKQDGAATAAATLGAHDQEDLRDVLRMVGLRWAADHRSVRVSIWNPVKDSWIRPNGETTAEMGVYAVELDVRVGSERV